jgi:hypothetical protein
MMVGGPVHKIDDVEVGVANPDLLLIESIVT